LSFSDITLRFISWSRKKRYAPDLPTLIKLLEPRKDDVILDVGAGTGVITSSVAELCDEVFALEPNASRVAYIQKKYPQVKAFIGSAESITFPESYFTKILTISAFHHFKDQDASLGEFNRVMKPGGLLLIHEQPPESRSSRTEGNFAKAKFLSDSDLRAKVESQGFKVTEVRKAVHGYFLLSSNVKSP
jgi:ubiquinone/menaquinone biosynthesis C-methylase UbiE